MPKKWHDFWVRYYKLLLESCLDGEEMKRLEQKLIKHEQLNIR